MKPSTAEGDFAVIPDDEVPPYVELREVTTHREGTRLDRLSVVYAVRPDAPVKLVTPETPKR
jgi:hypothetical protein